MAKRAILLAGLLFLLASRGAAGYFDSGNKLYERCIAKRRSFVHTICVATAAAYMDMMKELGYSCPSSDMTRAEIADVLIKFLKDNPERRKKAAASLAIEAFKGWPGCTSP
jgi:hypothetical protein